MLISLDAFGTDVMSRELLRFGQRSRNMSPILGDIRDDFFRLEERLFDTEGASGGKRWAPLSDLYAPWKEVNYPGTKILEREGTLRDSLTGRGSFYSRVTDDEMVVASRAPHGRFHQRGTRKMPARPPVQLTEVDKRRWIKALQRYVVTGERSRGTLSGLLGDVF